MDFGIHIGTRGCLTSRENVMAVAQRAEALGYAYLGVADHLIVPVQTDSALSVHRGRHLAGRRTGECFDCIATLAFLAGCTQRIKLLTSVVVVPYRPAVLTAKLFVDGGRAVRRTRHRRRRRRLDARGVRRPGHAAVRRARRGDRRISGGLAALWTTATAGAWTASMRSSTMWCSRRSRHRQPHLPIWVGGESAPCAAAHGEVRRCLVSGVEQRSRSSSTRRRGCRRASSDCIAWRRRPAGIRRRSISPICGSRRPCGRSSAVPTAAADVQRQRRMTCWRTPPRWRQPGREHAIFYLQRPTIEETLDVHAALRRRSGTARHDDRPI